MADRTFEVEFAVEEYPDTEREVVTVESGVTDGADPEERAVVAAAEKSPYSHAETVAIREQEQEDN